MHDSLYRNSVFLVANTLASSVIGFAFWAIAARVYSPSEVGIASAIISASAFFATISYLGFDYSLIKYIPSSKNVPIKIGTAFTVTAVMSILAASAYLAITPFFAHSFEFLITSSLTVLLFIILILMTTWNGLTNSVLIAFRVTQYVALATALSGIFKITLALVLKSNGRFGLILAHTIGLAVSVVLSFRYIKKASGYTYVPTLSKSEIASTIRFTAASYSASTASGVPLMLLPVIIIKFLGADQAAYFYIVIMVVTLLNMFSQSTAQSLFAEGSWDNKSYKEQTFKAARTIMTFLLPGILFFIIFGKIGLSIYGESYAKYGYLLLVILSLSSIPKVFNQIIGTSLRVHDNTKPLIIITSIGAAITIGVSLVTLSIGFGLTSVGIAILVSDSIVAMLYYYVSFIMPSKGRHVKNALGARRLIRIMN